MKIFIGSDHAGFRLKEKIITHLKKNNFEVKDTGAHNYNPNDDYPDFIIPTAKKVAKTKGSRGIILGGSGQGEAIAANKVKGIRAVVLHHYDKKIIKLSREHNDANVLSLGARFLSQRKALKAVDLWLKTPFSRKERHKRRIKKIEEYEKKK